MLFIVWNASSSHQLQEDYSLFFRHLASHILTVTGFFSFIFPLDLYILNMFGFVYVQTNADR